MTVPWLKWLVTSHSLWRFRFDTSQVCVGFVMDKVALRHVFLP